MKYTVQYIIIGIIFLLVAVWIWRKISCMRKRKGSGCCGCALSETCSKRKEQQ